MSATIDLADYKHRKAIAKAGKLDTRFFNANPDRCFHIRPALPNEARPAETLPGVYIALVMIIGITAHRYYFPVNDPANYPDEEEFLTRLWTRVHRDDAKGTGINISGGEIKQMLVDTGH